MSTTFKNLGKNINQNDLKKVFRNALAKAFCGNLKSFPGINCLLPPHILPCCSKRDFLIPSCRSSFKTHSSYFTLTITLNPLELSQSEGLRFYWMPGLPQLIFRNILTYPLFSFQFTQNNTDNRIISISKISNSNISNITPSHHQYRHTDGQTQAHTDTQTHRHTHTYTYLFPEEK